MLRLFSFKIISSVLNATNDHKFEDWQFEIRSTDSNKHAVVGTPIFQDSMSYLFHTSAGDGQQIPGLRAGNGNSLKQSPRIHSFTTQCVDIYSSLRYIFRFDTSFVSLVVWLWSMYVMYNCRWMLVFFFLFKSTTFKVNGMKDSAGTTYGNQKLAERINIHPLLGSCIYINLRCCL